MVACAWVVTITVVNEVRFQLCLQDRDSIVKVVACEGEKERK